MQISVSETVAASRDEVFAAYTDLDRVSEAITAITRLEELTPARFGEGTRWRETRKEFGKTHTEEMWVAAFHPPAAYTVQAQSHGTRYETTFTFEAVDAQATRVTITFVGTPETFGAKVMSPMWFAMKGSVRKMFARDLLEMKAACEA